MHEGLDCYFRVNEEIIWDVIKNKIPDLKDKLSKLKY